MAIKINIPSKNTPAKVPNAVSKIQEAMKSQVASEKEIREQITGLTTDDAPILNRVQDAIAHIEKLWEEEGAPVATIRIGLQEVMKLLSRYEDVVLELEPEDISSIVSSYMALTDVETRSIFDKAAKKTAKKKAAPISKTVKEIMKAAKEDTPDDDSFLDDLGI